MRELIYSSATRLGDAIAKKEISSLELTKAHLRRIDEINPKLNAVFFVAAESALRSAHTVDEELSHGIRRSPLHGVPFTVKDWIEVAGFPCIANDERYRNYFPSENATVVQRMLDAGCVMLGKTTVFDDSPVYGRTNNPYRLDCSPGGSSSGEAAIIAAGGSPLGLGSDSGGSIRDPAHLCGIAGIRPTTGRIPITGHLPRIQTFIDPRTVIGPMARFVDDLSVALSLLAGPDWRDPSVVPMPLPNSKAVNLKDLKGAFYSHYEGSTPSPDSGATILTTAGFLEDSGIVMEHALPNRIEEALTITQEYWGRTGSEGISEEWASDGEGTMSGLEVERHLFHWDRFRRTLISFMGRFDFILTPVSDFAAQPFGSSAGVSYCLPYSLAGYPCVVVRGGTSEEGLPIGVQIVAQPWREDVALAIAKHIETSLCGWKPPAL